MYIILSFLTELLSSDRFGRETVEVIIDHPLQFGIRCSKKQILVIFQISVHFDLTHAEKLFFTHNILKTFCLLEVYPYS
jgi:hypothetical protein